MDKQSLDELFDAETLNSLEAKVGTSHPNFNEAVADQLLTIIFFDSATFTNTEIKRSDMIEMCHEYFGY